MRLSNFSPATSQVATVGLSPIAMPRLGQVVVLAGRNGSGKTRALRILRETVAHLSTHWSLKDEDVDRQLKSYTEQSERNDLPASTKAQSINMAQLLTLTQELRRRTTFMGLPQLAVVAEFAPSPAQFADPLIQSRAAHIASHKKIIDAVGMAKVNSDAPSYLDHIATLSFNATHPDTLATESERETCAKGWSSLKAMVENLLPGAGLARNVEGGITLFSRPIGSAGLSDGQRALLRVAVALHAQSSKLDEAILVLDEPENHLHPDALVEFIDRLIKVTRNGQVWIATHSIHILSYVDPESIWYVENGKISWAGRQPERVLRSLVGDEERVGRLERFIHLPSVLAMERFAAECLLPPSILTTGAEDPQSKQIHQIIENSRVEGRVLRFLDYGAGRGRILATLRQGVKDLPSHIDYRAFEPDPGARQDCIGAVSDAYNVDLETAKKQVYDSELDLRQKLSEHSVNVAVMCNVLHEIHPSKWRRLFTEQMLSYALHAAGYLLILEDMKIPYGERAHKDGFILLDTEQLQTLFAVNKEDPAQFSVHADPKDGRLKAHLIRADALKNVTDETVKQALNRRLDSAGDRIQELRESPPSFVNGHLLALYTMIYANTALALR